MPRRQKLYHYIYKTTCLVTGRFYVGMHSTDDLEDGYLGSGKILGYSITKHGRENHRRDIIEMCPSREALKLREKEIVNEQLLADPLNINLKYGGDGGFDHLNSAEAIDARRWTFAIWADAGHNRQRYLLQNDPGYRAKRMPSILRAVRLASAASRAANPNGTFSGRKHSEETKQKMRKPKNVGSANSQFGTCWVTNGTPVKIKKEQLDEYLIQGYRRGRK